MLPSDHSACGLAFPAGEIRSVPLKNAGHRHCSPVAEPMLGCALPTRIPWAVKLGGVPRLILTGVVRPLAARLPPETDVRRGSEVLRSSPFASPLSGVCWTSALLLCWGVLGFGGAFMLGAARLRSSDFEMSDSAPCAS